MGEIELDPATRSVRRDGEPVELTSVEFNLLEVLLREAGRVVPRERLVNAVLSRKFSPFDRSIDMHVSKVRKKLGDTDADEHIKTIRGVGYIFARPREKAGGKEGWGKGEDHVMKTLFLKIFLSFWAALALFLVLAILVMLALRPQRNSTWDALRTTALNDAIAAYEHGGTQQAHDYRKTYSGRTTSGLTFSMNWETKYRDAPARVGPST